MSNNSIKPEKITKPIQLLAAWLIGLVLVVTALLTAAGNIEKPNWLPALLSIAAVSSIPLFLMMIFLLQTKYRPEMQEDSYYSQYLNKNTGRIEPIENNKSYDREIQKLSQEIINISVETKSMLDEINNVVNDKTQTNKPEVINKIITESDKKIEELKSIAKYTGIDLRINEKLIQYQKIKQIVQELGFNSYEIFGNEQSRFFLVSFGKHIPLSIVKDIVVKLFPLGLEYISLIKEEPWLVRTKTIYIGSYAFSKETIVVDKALIEVILNDSEDLSFESFLAKHEFSLAKPD